MAHTALLPVEKLKAAASADAPSAFASPPTTSRPSRRCSAPSSSTTRRSTASRAFLDPQHFYDPLHAQIYETAAKLIQAGKQATPITLKTFFENAEPIDADLTVPQYLGRLAANATTIINAHDYGRTVYDLAIRRELIMIGEDVVNGAYDSPVDYLPQGADRGGREPALRDRRARQVRPGLPRPSAAR